ncbi:MAG: phosphoribosyltransferase family protein [Flavobacteriaceae bacterium]
MSQNLILNPIQINHKIRRIAYQIYETFPNEKELVIAGISGNGYVFAEKLTETLQEITPIKVLICEVKINKKKPMEKVETSLKKDDYKDKAVILVDDVLHSGTTLIYGVKHFLEVPLKKLKTAVLVDRNHKKFPIKVDFKGISLSTSLQEHVSVSFDQKTYGVYL